MTYLIELSYNLSKNTNLNETINKLLEKAAFAATYKSVWCAGPSIEFVEKTETINEIITRISQEYQEAYRDMQSKNIWI